MALIKINGRLRFFEIESVRFWMSPPCNDTLEQAIDSARDQATGVMDSAQIAEASRKARRRFGKVAA